MSAQRNLKQIRKSLIGSIDPSLRRPDRSVLAYLIAYLSLYWAFFLFVLMFDIPLFAFVIPMGVLLQLIANVNHEILHGNVVRSRFWTNATTLPGMLLILTSPHFWRHTHHFHHRTLDLWTKGSSKLDEPPTPQRSRTLIAKCIFVLRIFCLDSLHFRIKQISILRSVGFQRVFREMTFFAIFLEVLTIVTFHLALGVLIGAAYWFELVFLPLLVFSFISSCFFITSHARALWTPDSEQFRIFSVRTSPAFDKFFFHLGYHVEHHLFPDVPQKHLPIIADFLEQRRLFQDQKLNQFDAIRRTFLYDYRVRFSDNADAG